jgi:integrase
MDGMPRPRPPHLHRQVTRHGKTVWYVRIGKGPRIRIRSAFGTPEFNAAYRAAINGQGQPPQDDSKFPAKTLGWLIENYRKSETWAELSAATRRQREGFLRAVTESGGKHPLRRIDQQAIKTGIRRRKGPNAKRHFLQTMRGLFQWAKNEGHIAHDPTAGLVVERPQTEGHHVWTDDECIAFEARWPRGTRERLAFDLLLYTGLRRGDAVRLGRQHVRNGVATIRTEKTGQRVTITILPPLQESINAGPIGDLTFIATKDGRPMTKESFGNWFKEACRKANVPGSAHGLRKAGATRAVDNGATEAQLEAMFGWSRGSSEARVYTQKADRARLAKQGAEKLLSERDMNIYSLTLHKGEGDAWKTRN